MKKLLLIPILIILTLQLFAQDPLTLSRQTTTAIQSEQAKLNNLALFSQGQADSITTLNTKLTAVNKSIDSLKAIIVKLTNTGTGTGPIVVTPPPTGATVNVGDGKSQLVIDGLKTKYPSGTTIIVKPGTYPNDITIQNLTGVNVVGTGVIIDGLNSSKDGQFNSLHLSGLNTVVISGFKIQNVLYRPLYIDYQLKNTTLESLSFINCGDQWSVDYSMQWDGTDNTVSLLNFKILNCTFNNTGIVWLDGNTVNGTVVNMVKGLEVAGNTFTNSNCGNLVDCRACDNFSIHDNVVSNINVNNKSDTRLFMLAGNGQAYKNTFTNIRGHSIALNPISFSATTRTTSKFYKNITTGSLYYSQFEYQSFPEQIIPGLTQSGNLIIDSNTAININTEHYGFNGAFIDNYMGYNPSVKDYGTVTLTNNTGQNFWPVPAVQNGQAVLWNLATPTISSGNIYIK